MFLHSLFVKYIRLAAANTNFKHCFSCHKVFLLRFSLVVLFITHCLVVIGKLGGFFKGDKKKRGKKRKLDGDSKFYEPSGSVDVDLKGNASASPALPSAENETDFVIVNTPDSPRKEGNIEVNAPLSAEADVQMPDQYEKPKSPSLLRRIGMFFHIHSGGFDVEGESKKKKRKTVGTKSGKFKSDIDIETQSHESSVKREDSFTIPEATLPSAQETLPSASTEEKPSVEVALPNVQLEDSDTKMDVETPHLAGMAIEDIRN